MDTQIVQASKDSIEMLAAHLLKDELVAVPSETVYGLAGRGLSEEAMRKIFAAKERPLFDPLILHIAKPHMNSTLPWQTLVDSGLIDLAKIPKLAQQTIEKLVNKFWPGPLTMVLPRSSIVPDLATSGLDTVAIRMPQHPVFQDLLACLKEPLAAPSANRFGRISPTESKHVLSELEGRISYILEGGACEFGVESSIIGLEINSDTDFHLVIYRPGSLSLEDIQEVAGITVKRALHSDKPVAPGMLKSHYAPKKQFNLQEDNLLNWDSSVIDKMQQFLNQNKKLGLLLAKTTKAQALDFLNQTSMPADQFEILSLSDGSDSFEAAKNLFKYLRILDASDVACIFAELWPEEKSIGFAIRDRMNRAAAK